MFTAQIDIRLIEKLCEENDVDMLGVFGSVARGEETVDSDIDILVRFSKRTGLLSLIRLERELSGALGREVDLLTEKAISPYLREQILADLRVLYGKK